jgi:hypothetical protein
MLKKTLLAMFGLVFAIALVAPPKANAAVVIGVGVGPRPAYGFVVGHPRPYGYAPYVAPAPYAAYGPGYVYPPYVYPGRVVVGYRPYGYRYGWRGGWRR